MLFYIAIFLACLAIGLLLPLLFRVLSGAGNVVAKTARPLSKTQSTSHLSPHVKRAIRKDPWALQLALVSAENAAARQEMGGDDSYYDSCKEYSVPHRATMLHKRAARTSREERRVVESATYKVSREVRVLQSDSNSALANPR